MGRGGGARGGRSGKGGGGGGGAGPAGVGGGGALGAFAAAALAAAESVGLGGRFGGDKVFISAAHEAYVKLHGPISLEQFKSNLLAARTAGHLALSRADLVEAMNPRLVRASEASPGRGEAHFIQTGTRAAEAGRAAASREARAAGIFVGGPKITAAWQGGKHVGYRVAGSDRVFAHRRDAEDYRASRMRGGK